MSALTPRELALHCARIIDDKGGLDLAVLELPRGHALFDFALIVTGRSNRQVAAIVDEVLHFCKRHKIAHLPAEGESGWHLIDCYEVVVHALSQELRDFYRLERLWPLAKPIDFERELKDLPRLEPVRAEPGRAFDDEAALADDADDEDYGDDLDDEDAAASRDAGFRGSVADA